MSSNRVICSFPIILHNPSTQLTHPYFYVLSTSFVLSTWPLANEWVNHVSAEIWLARIMMCSQLCSGPNMPELHSIGLHILCIYICCRIGCKPLITNRIILFIFTWGKTWLSEPSSSQHNYNLLSAVALVSNEDIIRAPICPPGFQLLKQFLFTEPTISWFLWKSTISPLKSCEMELASGNIMKAAWILHHLHEIRHITFPAQLSWLHVCLKWQLMLCISFIREAQWSWHY